MSKILKTIEDTENVYNTFVLLIIGLACAALAWYINFRWQRRRFYALAAKIPGPKGYPLVGNINMFSTDTCKSFYELYETSKKYPVAMKAWLGPRLIVFLMQPKDIEIVMNKCVNKSEFYDDFKIGVGDGLFTAEGTIWRQNRKVISNIFSQKNLDAYVEVFSRRAMLLAERIKKALATGKPFDVYEFIHDNTIDTTCETALGLEAYNRDRNIGHYLDRMVFAGYVKATYLPYHIDFIFNRTKYGIDVYHCMDKVLEFSDQILRTKKEEYRRKLEGKEFAPEAHQIKGIKERKAFIDLLLDISHNGNHIEDKAIIDEVTTFIVAGAGTTATTLGFVLLTLGMNPELQQKVYEEAIDILGPDREVLPDDLPKLKYTEMFIKETLRVFPVAVYVGRHNEKERQVGDYTIPADATVVPFIYNIHMNPEIYPDPYKFDPERFLPEEVAKRHPYSFVAFSGGLRNCIGMKYAYMSLKAVISTLVRKFHFSTDYKRIEDVILAIEFLIKPVGGLKIKIKPRNE